MRKPKQRKPSSLDFKNSVHGLWEQYFALTQVCRRIRIEYLPLFRFNTIDIVTPQHLYEYIDTFLALPGMSDDQVIGSVLLDFEANVDICLDIKPLLQRLRKSKNLRVGTYDFTTVSEVEGVVRITDFPPPPELPDVLVEIYDIHNVDSFYDYVEMAMMALELEHGEQKGIEIVFVLKPEYWEDWMGEWSKPDHDPNYRIPLELADNVVQWGRGCGMELNRAAGSHLTVNFRRGQVEACSSSGNDDKHGH